MWVVSDPPPPPEMLSCSAKLCLGLPDGWCSSVAVPWSAFFLCMGLLCVCVGGRGGGGYDSFILVTLTKTWGILDSRIAVHSTNKKTQCKSGAREATKTREGPCSTGVLNSESGCVQPTAQLLCNLPVSWQTPTPVHAKSPPRPLPSHVKPAPPLIASQPLGPSHFMASTPPPKELDEMGASPPSHNQMAWRIDGGDGVLWSIMEDLERRWRMIEDDRG